MSEKGERGGVMWQILSPYFTAGVVFRGDTVVRVAPILHYMRGWNRVRVAAYCGKKKWAVLVLLALLLSCNATPTRDNSIPDSVRIEWAIGQQNLALYVGDRANLIWPEQFKWEHWDRPIPCGEIPDAWGCFFAPRGLIQWYTLRVIRHEAGHAILWKLGDPRWQCFEHEQNCLEQK